MLIPEIKSWEKNIRVGAVRNASGHPGHKVSGWNEQIFDADVNSGKLRNTLIIFGWLRSKMDMGL